MTKMSLGDVLAYQVKRDPDHVAIVCGDASITRLELEQVSNRAAHAFADLGVLAGDLVTIVLPNGIDFYVATLAAWKLGATPQPISTRLAPTERDEIIGLADPALVVGLDPALTAGRPTLPAGWTPATELPDTPVSDRPTSACWKAMTSGGSTGRPKIIVSKDPAERDPDAPSLGMTIDGVQLVPGPLHHNGPFMFSAFGLAIGATLVVMPRFDAAGALALIERHRVDWVFLVPTMMHRIWRLPEAERDRYDISSLRFVYSTGAPWPVWLKEAWIGWLGAEKIFEGYGGTEGQGGTAISGVDALTHPGSVGKPATGFRMRVLDDEGRELPPGEVGEVYFMPDSGPGSTYAYIGAEPKIRDGWETIGDLGYLDADGFLYLVDRRTDLIVTGAANVYPAEVEAAIDAFPGVRSSAVVGLPDDDLGQRVHAIVDVGDTGTPLADDELVAHLRTRIAGYKVPRSFEFVSEPLRDDAGKVRRAALRDARLPVADS